MDDQRQLIIELEDELQAAEDARSRLEVNMTVLKQDMGKAIEENATDSLRSLNNQLRIYQSKLQEENVSKLRLGQYVKSLELDLQDIRQQHEQAKKECSEAKLVNRRMQVNSFVRIFPQRTHRSSFPFRLKCARTRANCKTSDRNTPRPPTSTGIGKANSENCDRASKR